MTIGPRPAVAAAAVAVLAVLAAGCGRVHADQPPGAAPAPAVSAAERSAPTARCPAHPPARPVSDAAGTATSLEPLVADRLLLCAYDGPFGRPTAGALTRHALVTDAAVVARVRAQLDGLGPVPKGGYHCPNDTGASVLAFFTDGVSEVQLTDKVTGCQTVSNGSVTRWVGASPVNGTVAGLLGRS